MVRVKQADLAKMSPEDRAHVLAAVVAVAKLPRSSSSEEPELTRTPICGQRYSHYGTINPPLMCTAAPGHGGTHSTMRDGKHQIWPLGMSDAENAALRSPADDTTQVMSPEGVVSVVHSVYRQQGGL